MTYDELIKRERREPVKHSEHDIQTACVHWFRLQYPQLAPLLFAVPNGTNKSRASRAHFKEEGLLSGVSDMLLLIPRCGYHGLCIEMKTRTGRQSETQKAWQLAVEGQGYRYIVLRSLDEFMKLVNNYMK